MQPAAKRSDEPIDSVPPAAPTPAAARRVPFIEIFDYALPTFGLGFMFLFFAIYLMKHATDVLGISPVMMGTILLGARIWDAFADPVAGYLSDRTRSRWGRRRPWFLAAGVLLPISYVLVWAPPAGASLATTTFFVGAWVVVWYTSTTILLIPHFALGAELSDDYHDRSRIFGVRHVMWTLGSVAAVAALALLIGAEDKKATALNLAIAAAVVTAALIFWTTARVRERPEFQGRGAENPFAAIGDVWRNPHARLLFIVFGIESLGGATIGVLTPYVGEYIVRTPERVPQYIFLYMVASVIFVPVWLPLSRRFGKKALWLFAMGLTALAFGGMFFLTEGAVVLISCLAFVAGLAASCGAIVGPSVQADVIDWDEHATGQRKEGTYFAVWNFIFKIATGVTQFLTGWVLSFSGFVPNEPQTEGTKLAILSLYALFPLACYGIGTILFMRFSLTAESHAAIRAELDLRRGA